MKVAIFSESPADEAAVRVLLDAILGHASEPIALSGLRTRGWTGILATLPAVLKQLHYHTDADALAVVADSDDSPLHDAAHGHSTGCRLCALRALVETEQAQLTPVAGRSQLRIAIGIAAPALEAWLLAGIDVHVTEATWSRGLQTKQRPYSRRELKRRAYGVEPVPLAVQTKKMVEQARRLSSDLSPLAKHFPIGFGEFCNSIRTW